MAYSIERAHVRDLIKVKPFWKAMVEHYHETLAGKWPVRPPNVAWQLRHQEYMTWINEGTGVVFLARDDMGQAVGYAALRFSAQGSTFDLGESIGELESLAVDPAHRNRGIGVKLIQACRQELVKRDISYWTLNTLADDPRTQRLYARAGFAPFMLKMVQSVDEAPPVDPAFTAAMPVVPMPTTAPVAGGSAGYPGAAADGSADGFRADLSEADAGDRREAGSRPGVAGGGGVAEVRAAESRRTVQRLATAARVATAAFGALPPAEKNELVRGIADLLVVREEEILTANRQDLDRGLADGLATTRLQELRLEAADLEAMADRLRAVADMPERVGEVIGGATLPNGLQLRQIRVPLGVIGLIHETQPDAVIDVVGLALKSGNAVLVCGTAAASATNRALLQVVRDSLIGRRLTGDLIALLDGDAQDAVELMRSGTLVDLIIPRGDREVLGRVAREATVPSFTAAGGHVHVYVDAEADQDMARAIVLDAKTARPGQPTTPDTLLVHQEIADVFLPGVLEALHRRGVRLHGDLRVCGAGRAVDVPVDQVTDAQWAKEFEGQELAIGVTDQLESAIRHVRRYSTGYVEVIVTEDRATAREWIAQVDAAVVVVNASTRFADPGELGLGPHLGINTGKLPVRGPIGLRELTSTTWVLEGDGQVR